MSGAARPRARSWRWLPLVLAPALLLAQSLPRPDLSGAEAPVRARLESLAQRLETDPGDAATWGLYGMVLDAHDFTAEALIAYRRAHELDPKEFRWPYLYATLTEAVDPEDAVNACRAALELRPAYAPGHVRLAQTLEGLGREAEALEHYRRAAELDPKNPFGPFGVGRIALSRGDLGTAITELERAYRIQPDLKSLLVTLAQAYHRAGKSDLARARAEEARKLPRTTYRPDPVRAAVSEQAVDLRSYLGRARSARDRGDLPEARRQLAAALAIDPGLAEARYSLAQVHALEGDAEKALAEARAAQRLDPELPGASSFLAATLFGLGRLAEAEAEARAALARDAGDTQSLLTLSMVAAEQGRSAEAVLFVDRAYRTRPTDPDDRRLLKGLLLELAVSFAQAGLFPDAAQRMDWLVVLAAEDADPDAANYRLRLERYRAGRP